jgi:TonB family protein
LPSVPAAESGPPADTVDSSQLVASWRQSLADASTAGGKLGKGRGGARGPGATGGGGVSGPGFQSSPLGYGPGGSGRSDNDPRINVYSQRLKAKLHPYWADAFPRWAIADMRQGRVIITIEIQGDGSVRHAYVTRASGINEFDRNCLRAVHAASPFEPIPKALGLARMRLEIGFDATNPLVR